MTTNLTIIDQYDEFDHNDTDHLVKANQSLELEVKRLRKEKEHLIEQMSLLKKFSDGQWNMSRMDLWQMHR